MTRFVLVLAMLSYPSSGAARTMGLEDITSIDPLGYECIDAHYFEEDDPTLASVAFQVGGKIKLPRTCLPDPCDTALNQSELASLTGTDPRSFRFAREWDEYYARYADYCRRETTPVVGDTVASGDDGGFWDGVLSTPGRRNTVLANDNNRSTIIPINLASVTPTTSNGPTTGVLPDETVLTGTTEEETAQGTDPNNPVTPRTPDTPTEEGILGNEVTPDDPDDDNRLPTQLAPVPLPPSSGFLLAGAVAFFVARRRKAS